MFSVIHICTCKCESLLPPINMINNYFIFHARTCSVHKWPSRTCKDSWHTTQNQFLLPFIVPLFIGNLISELAPPIKLINPAHWDCWDCFLGLLGLLSGTAGTAGTALGLLWDCSGTAVGLLWDCCGTAIAVPESSPRDCSGTALCQVGSGRYCRY